MVRLNSAIPVLMIPAIIGAPALVHAAPQNQKLRVGTASASPFMFSPVNIGVAEGQKLETHEAARPAAAGFAGAA